MFEDIGIDEDEGSIEGYRVSAKDENYKFFLADAIENDQKTQHIISFMEKKGYERITVIKNLNVERESRGQGIGKGLLESAVDGTQVAILISDKHESQIRSFVLNKFYENADFEKVINTSTGYLMCYPSHAANELKEHLKECLKIDKKNIKKMKI